MDIYLSVNNRDNPAVDLLTIPVMPPEFRVQKPQGGQEFETVTAGTLNLIGTPKLKSISWSSFFPVRDYAFLRDRTRKGFEYVYMIDLWILQKLPIRLIIDGTPINMAVSVSDFNYHIGTTGDLEYDITLKECPLPDTPDLGDELTVAQYDELKGMLGTILQRLGALEAPMIYNYIDENMPEWARGTIKKLVDNNYIQGDENGNLALTDNMLRIFVALDRAGIFK